MKLRTIEKMAVGALGILLCAAMPIGCGSSGGGGGGGGPITVTSLNGGNVLLPGTIAQITWNTSLSDVALRYSTDGGTTWKLIGNGSVDTSSCQWRNFAWSVPNDPSPTVLIRVEDYNDNMVFDESDAVLTISTHTLATGATPNVPFTLTLPNGGEVIPAGSTYNITWTTAAGYADANLYYSIDCGTNWNLINTSATINNGDPEWENYPWTVPTTLSDTVFVRVEDYNDPATADISDGSFRIVAPITVVSPNGAETYSTGATVFIQWSTAGVTDVNLRYSDDGGSSWTWIAQVDTSTPSTWGNYPWDTTGITSTNVLIRIEDYLVPATYDDSDAVFTVQ